MPTPLTPAPFRSPLSGSTVIDPAGPWWTWFELLRGYVLGFSNEPDADIQAQMNIAYIANGVGLVTLTLPERLKVNDYIQVMGKGAGGWRIQLNSGQIIRGTSSTTSGGTLSSNNRYDSVTLKVMTTDAELSVVSQVGTLTYA